MYPGPSRATRKRKGKAEVLEERFSRIENLLRAAKSPRLTESAPPTTSENNPLTACRATPALANNVAPHGLCLTPPVSVAARPNVPNVNYTPSYPSQTTIFNRDTDSFLSNPSHIREPTQDPCPSNDMSIEDVLSTSSQQPQRYGRRNSKSSACRSSLGASGSSSGTRPTIISPTTVIDTRERVSGPKDNVCLKVPLTLRRCLQARVDFQPY